MALVILGVLGTIVAWALVNTVYALKYARCTSWITLTTGSGKHDVPVPPAYELLVTPWVRL